MKEPLEISENAEKEMNNLQNKNEKSVFESSNGENIIFYDFIDAFVIKCPSEGQLCINGIIEDTDSSLFNGKSVSIKLTPLDSNNGRRLTSDQNDVGCKMNLISAEQYRIDCDVTDKSVKGNLNGVTGKIDNNNLIYITNTKNKNGLNYQNIPEDSDTQQSTTESQYTISKRKSSDGKSTTAIIVIIILGVLIIVEIIIVIICCSKRKRQEKQKLVTEDSTSKMSTSQK